MRRVCDAACVAARGLHVTDNCTKDTLYWPARPDLLRCGETSLATRYAKRGSGQARKQPFLKVAARPLPALFRNATDDLREPAVDIGDFARNAPGQIRQ